jgi:hypothetical protein
VDIWALGVREGDEFIIPANTFIASALAVSAMLPALACIRDGLSSHRAHKRMSLQGEGVQNYSYEITLRIGGLSLRMNASSHSHRTPCLGLRFISVMSMSWYPAFSINFITRATDVS